MMSQAFVNSVPVVSGNSVTASTSCFVTRSVGISSVSTPSTRRSRVVVMKIEPEEHTVPEGFTRFSENLNGRAAMVGFVLAVVTEAITGKGIVGQVTQLFKNVDAANVITN